MTLDRTILTLARGLNNESIGFDSFRSDVKTGSIELEMSLKYASLTERMIPGIVQWAINQYELDSEYTLKSKDGTELVKIDLREGVKAQDGRTSYGQAFDTLKELNLELDEESEQVLSYWESKEGTTPIDAVELLAKKKFDRDVNVIDEYLIDNGFEEGTYTREANFDLTGHVPLDFVGKCDFEYGLEESVLGAGTAKITKSHGVTKIEINSDALRDQLRNEEFDREKAHEFLVKMADYTA